MANMKNNSEFKTELLKHHMARLAMMKAEEKGKELSYKDALSK